jgi:hypothetical protein
MLTQFDSLYSLFEAFPDEQSCIDHLRSIRWRDGEFCPYCGGNKVYHFSDRKTFKCGEKECGQRFSIRVGTIFEDTKLPLRKWFAAIWMITNHPKGIASTTLAKDLKITQKSAWFVLHRLRHAARTPSFNAPLKGTVESDTTFVGGKEKNRHSRDRKGGQQGGAGKEVVLGMVERDGELRATHISEQGDAANHVKKNVERKSVLMTDEDRVFRGLNKDYLHLTVRHSMGEYVRGSGVIHTQKIESVWALLKRQIVGTHHWVSPKHLQKYVDEMSWRFNRRDLDPSPRMNDIFSCVEGHLTYKALTA